MKLHLIQPMQFKGVRTITMGGILVQVFRQIDNLDCFKWAFLKEHVKQIRKLLYIQHSAKKYCFSSLISDEPLHRYHIQYTTPLRWKRSWMQESPQCKVYLDVCSNIDKKLHIPKQEIKSKINNMKSKLKQHTMIFKFKAKRNS